MYDSTTRSALVSVLLDLAPWSLASGLFLLAYVDRFHAPASAIWPHVQLVVAAWLVLTCLKLLVPKPWSGRTAIRLVFSLMTMAVLGALVFYYSLVILGLASWGRVVTWPLISAYAAQFPALLAALGYSPALPLVALTIGFLLLWLVVRRWCMGWTWLAAVQARLTRAGFSIILILCGLLPAVVLAKFAVLPASARQEPVALTFRLAGGNLLQDHAKAGPFGDDEDVVRAKYTPNANAIRRNVILIVGDALRADHMGVYGYGRMTSPHIDALFRDQPARRANMMRAVCAESSCGLLGIAASRYVHRLPTRPITLQEVLQRHGYKVHLILGGDHTNFYGLREAYGPVDSYFDGQMQSARYMNDDRLLLDYISNLVNADGAQPVMFQFHLMSTHGLGKRPASSMRYQPFRNYYSLLRTDKKVSAGLREETINYYDNGMVQFDSIVDALLRALQARGYLDDALVVITGDHGEMLGEHDMLSHANSVYESVLSIPMIMIGYGFTPRAWIDRGLASQIDIGPTILTELRMPIPETWAGRPLQNQLRRDTVWFQQGTLTGLYDLREPGRVWKYWRNWLNGNEYAFELEDDPKESRNLISSIAPEKLNEWRRAVIDSAAAAGFEQ
jgi:glucan phosphoethanolaminetransferase (alkaline phosphatase superfamily)